MSSKARTQSDALKRYRSHLQLSLSCVSDAVWQYGPTTGKRGEYALFTSEDPLLLHQADGTPLYLKATQEFHYGRPKELPKEWKVVTDAYAYTLSEFEDLSRETFAWHWHPDPERSAPHIHIGRGDPECGALAKLHVPCGRVSFEQILLFLILDLDIETGRDNWQKVLTERDRVFRDYMTWA